MVLHQRFLDRMKDAIIGRKILDRDERLAIQHRQEVNTSIDGLVAQSAVREIDEDHRARTAIALVASLLRARPALGEADIVEHRRRRLEMVERNDLTVADETNGRAHRLAPPIGRIAIGREQQRHVVVTVRLGDAEGDHDLV